MSNAIFGKGSLLQVETAVAGVFQTIAECKTITGPTLEAAKVPVTNHDSPGNFAEYIRGVIEGGEVSAEFNFQPNDSTHAQLFADLLDGTKRNYRVRWAQMTPVHKFTFEGFVQRMPITSPVDNVLTAALTVAVTGSVVLASE